MAQGGQDIEPESFWDAARWKGYDGYDIIPLAERFGWHVVPAWGAQGWDLGQWPYVMVFERDGRMVGGERVYDVATYCEGDIFQKRFADRASRDAEIDGIAFFYWKLDCRDWVAGVDSAAQMPAHLRGAYTWKRAQTAEARERGIYDLSYDAPRAQLDEGLAR